MVVCSDEPTENNQEPFSSFQQFELTLTTLVTNLILNVKLNTFILTVKVSSKITMHSYMVIIVNTHLIKHTDTHDIVGLSEDELK